MHENADVAPRSTELTLYERGERDAISKWLEEPPGVIAGALNKIASPVANAIRSVVPEAAIATAIEGADWMARTSIVDSVPVEPDDLARCDQSAEAARKWAVACAAGSGGAGGTLGLLGMALDTPAVIVLALRTIRVTGTCYGYGRDAASERGEKEFVLGILSAAGANSQEEKVAALLVLRQAQIILTRQTFKSMATSAGKLQIGIITARSLAKQLGINLTKRKMLQAVPVLGGLVGATTNGVFINDVYWAARRSYQKRWLEDRGLWQQEDVAGA